MPTPSVQVRNAVHEDIPAILEVAKRAYASWPSHTLATERNYQMQIDTFPSGQFVAVMDGKVVGYCSSLIVWLDPARKLFFVSSDSIVFCNFVS